MHDPCITMRDIGRFSDAITAMEAVCPAQRGYYCWYIVSCSALNTHLYDVRLRSVAIRILPVYGNCSLRNARGTLRQ